MNALLLAAGYGTRLRPYTNNIPKCLINIGGKPLLSYWLDHLFWLGCERVFINSHYLSDIVSTFVSSHPNNDRIVVILEKELRDTAGTVRDVIGSLGSKYLIAHADNFLTGSLEGFVHTQWDNDDAILRALCINVDEPDRYGIFELGDKGRIAKFVEKPKNSKSRIGNGAVYLGGVAFAEFVQENNFEGNISLDWLPMLAPRCDHFMFDGKVYDIGTIKELKLVRQLVDKMEVSPWGNA